MPWLWLLACHAPTPMLDLCKDGFIATCSADPIACAESVRAQPLALIPEEERPVVVHVIPQPGECGFCIPGGSAASCARGEAPLLELRSSAPASELFVAAAADARVGVLVRTVSPPPPIDSSKVEAVGLLQGRRFDVLPSFRWRPAPSSDRVAPERLLVEVDGAALRVNGTPMGEQEAAVALMRRLRSMDSKIVDVCVTPTSTIQHLVSALDLAYEVGAEKRNLYAADDEACRVQPPPP